MKYQWVTLAALVIASADVVSEARVMVHRRRVVLIAVMTVVLTTLRLASALNPLPFEIQNGRGAAGLTFTAHGGARGAPTWTRSVRIVVVGDATQSTENLRIVDPIVVETDAGTSVQIHTSLQPTKQDLAPGVPLVIELAGSFPAAGAFRGEIVLLQGARQRIVPLQVTVTPAAARVALPVQEHGGTSIAVTDGVLKTATLILPLRLQNTDTEPVEVVATFGGASRVDKVDGPSYQITMSRAGTTDQTRKIAAGAIATFDLPLLGLEDAGIYSVETLFGDPEGKYQPHSTKTMVYRRESAWCAALSILIGATLAWFIRSYVSDGSQRLALRRRIALLAEHIRAFRDGARREDLIAAARVLAFDVQDRQRDVQWGGKVEDVEKIISRAEMRLALLQDVAAATTQLEHINADRQPMVRKVLDAALVVVRIDPGDDGKIAAARDTVANLALVTVRREQILSQLTNLKAQLAAQKRVGTPKLVTALNAVTESLATAEDFVRSDNLDELEGLVEVARNAVLAACVAELASQADGPAPLGTDVTWQIDRAKIKAQLEIARASTDWAARYGIPSCTEALHCCKRDWTRRDGNETRCRR